uniref:Elongation factor-like 1 n=1 Tax=Romanomermis culicivorax TaxID=13658 RepID=A0A915K521_ROMCU
LIRSLLQQWLPLSAAVLSAVCSELPASDQISPEKIRGLFDTKTSPNLRESSSQIIKTGSIDTDSAVVVFVSKLFAVEKQQIASFNNSRNAESANFRVGFKNGALTDEEVEKLRQRVLDMKNVRFESEIETKSIDEIDTQSSQNVDADRFVLLAFARIYSGTLTAGQNVYVLDENTGGVSGPENQSPFVVESIYSMMGREFLPLQKTYAGNIVALSGEKLIDRLTGKVAALTSPMIDFAPFADLHFYAEPIVRVVVRPKNASDLSKMSEILKFISKIDPMIRTYVEQTGEHILATAGEMHLQKCIDDLTKRYSKLELNFSEPIVPFAETIVKEEEKTAGGGVKKKKNVEMWTANKQISVNVRAAPLPLSIIEILNHNDALLDRIDFAQQNPEALSSKDAEQFLDDVEKFYCELKTAFEKEGKKWKSAHSAVWSFGPRKARCNILFNKIPEYEKNRPNFWQFLYQKITNFSKTERTFDFGFPGSSSSNVRDCDQSFINGFRSLCQAGPLCSEILYGVGFFVENWSQQDDVTTTTTNNTENSCETIDQYGPLSGQLLTTVKEACKASFQAQNQRLMAAMYACTIRCTTEVLGKVYSVLNKRNGKVIGEEMNEGTNLFEISAVLPVIESFGFADEVRKKTSALASPQLVFSHWEVIGVDPFWVPTTQEELEHFGTKADTANRALKYMNMVRKRKGLEVDEQVVEFGTKQRTLIKK